MNIETRQAYSEVNRLLEIIGEEFSEKIPKKLKNYFKREMDKDYIPKIRKDIPIKEQKLDRKTIAIISSLNLQYWCRDEKRKTELMTIYAKNEIEYQKELREKYNPDELFKKKKEQKVEKSKEIQEQSLTIMQKEKWYQRILNIVKDLFKRK